MTTLSTTDRLLAQGLPKGGDRVLRGLLDVLPAGAYLCDAHGRITYFNSEAAALWGRTPRLDDDTERFCGSFRMYQQDGSPMPHDRCWMARALAENDAFNGCQLTIERPDGVRVSALAYASPIRDESGKLCGGLNVLVPANRSVTATEPAAAGEGHGKDAFLAMLSHELRNPLAPMRNALQILKLRAEGSAEVPLALAVLDRQLRQMTRLLEDLMDVSRMTQNRLSLRLTEVRVVDVVHDALETAQPLLEAGGHRFTLQMPGESITLKADAARLAQALSNLLDNAAKFTPRGGHITLNVRREGEEAVLRVCDNGNGIAPEALAAVFELFSGASNEDSQGGLGVGLALSRTLVELHGGTLEAHSDGVGKGAEFVVRLPAVMRRQANSSNESRPGGEERVSSALRILVVDDNVDSALTMAELLSLYGHEVRTAHDGLEALDIYRRFRPDVGVLDIGMPKMNGYALARRIRESSGDVQPLLIAVTGWGQEEDRIRSREAGFDHHLVKPVDPAELSSLVSARPSNGTLH